MAILMKTDGSVRFVEPKQSKHFELTELYDLLGCTTVERVVVSDSKVMWIDEEGKLLQKGFNKKATEYCHDSGILFHDHIVGTALLCDIL